VALLEDDEKFLRAKRWDWELVPDAAAGHCLIVKNYPVDSSKYDRAQVDLMVCIPAGYNDAKLDNFYVDPHLRLKNGADPEAASQMEPHAGKTWQRFSRHFNHWRPGIDSIRSIFPHIAKELQGKS